MEYTPEKDRLLIDTIVRLRASGMRPGEAWEEVAKVVGTTADSVRTRWTKLQARGKVSAEEREKVTPHPWGTRSKTVLDTYKLVKE